MTSLKAVRRPQLERLERFLNHTRRLKILWISLEGRPRSETNVYASYLGLVTHTMERIEIGKLLRFAKAHLSFSRDSSHNIITLSNPEFERSAGRYRLVYSEPPSILHQTSSTPTWSQLITPRAGHVACQSTRLLVNRETWLEDPYLSQPNRV